MCICGKWVIVEVIIKCEYLFLVMCVDFKQIDYYGCVFVVGFFFFGVNNIGLYLFNGIIVMFIVIGQDVVNVLELLVGIMYFELIDDGDLYILLIILLLIVVIYGGGIGIGIQKECLELMDCYGCDKVQKFVEIVGVVVLVGEILLVLVIFSFDWVLFYE